jgi:MYXO-CTERM domain-containing protein
MLAILFGLLASPTFPPAIAQQLGLATPPACTICHASNAGGAGTVTKRFGQYLQSRGLQAGDEDSLRNALLADQGEHHSSDGHEADLDALLAGDDPNGTRPGLDAAYGCSSGSAPGGLALLACFLLALRRRRTCL